ncbi:endonuclease domain-containing protein [Microbacterium sp. GCS4]|uniref:endonuclease domain-containing protein n=1 Tax=Microbacterium sp. GCS4 TaxID=1692239 RepID=UPI0006806D79|nr:DUF559 domain-containing protein [Microbacterium sp. GCS4]KNY05898.1 hypothetical protein AKH00_08590 [Microbacterium sp. GCS4]
MHHRSDLPHELGDSFSLSQASALGVRRGRADATDLARPFPGIRAFQPPTTFLETVSCYVPRLRDGQRFVGTTAVRLWGLPCPTGWRADEPLHIAVGHRRNPPRTHGVAGRRLALSRAQTWRVHGVPVVDPVAAVLSCAPELTADQLVVMLDAVITSSGNYPGLREVRRPRVTREELASRVQDWRGSAGIATVRWALRRTRDAVESPKETQTRLLIVDAGLPEPVIQHEVWSGGEFVARVDLAYPDQRIAIEYEGDGHRTDKAQWRRDIARQRRLEDLGWIVIRLTQHDLDAPTDVISRIRRALAARPSQP